MSTTDDASAGEITREEAFEIAQKTVHELSTVHEFAIEVDKTIEKPFGWVFFHAPKKFLETGDPGDCVPGVAPFVVRREDGAAEFFSSSVPPQRAIQIYEAKWWKAQLEE